MGIRSYGPGKFSTILDSYVYELTLDGGADREEGHPEGGGWYGFVDVRSIDADIQRLASGHKDRLTREELGLLNESVAAILFERSDGIVEVEWFDDEDDAEDAWEDIEEQFEDDEEGEED